VTFLAITIRTMDKPGQAITMAKLKPWLLRAKSSRSSQSNEVPRNASSSSTDEEDDGLLQEVDRLLSEYSINESENLDDENSINYDDVDFMEDDVDKLLEEMQ
ncbi:9021_t:CDS:2, partial [Dentiscutata heterogama]